MRALKSNKSTITSKNNKKKAQNCILYFRLGDWASGPKHQHHFKAITVRNRFTPAVIVPKETNEEEEVVEENDEEEFTKEEEKDEIEPVVHHEEEVEELADEEEGHQGIVPTSGEESFEDDFQIYNETEFVISNGNSTDEVVGNSYQFNHFVV